MPRKKPKIEIKKLSANAVMPTTAEGDPAGLDLYAAQDIVIPGRGTKPIKTDIALAIEEGYWGKIYERSGFSVRTSLGVKAGVIDSDYRGEIKIVMHNIDNFPEKVKKGDKIAQIIFHRQEIIKLEEVEEFTNPDTVRGDKGFGSSGT